MSRVSTARAVRRSSNRLHFAIMGFLALSGCVTQQAKEPELTPSEAKTSATSNKPVYQETGEASWYGPGFHGNKTANGDTFSQDKMTAAHRSLPLGTTAEVTNLENGKKAVVKVNDRGPYAKDRSIDLSRAAAKKLDMLDDGTTRVKIEVKSDRAPNAPRSADETQSPQ